MGTRLGPALRTAVVVAAFAALTACTGGPVATAQRAPRPRHGSTTRAAPPRRPTRPRRLASPAVSVRAVAIRAALHPGDRCYGAAAMAAPAGRCPPIRSGPLVETPHEAARDKSDAYGAVSGRKDCFARQPDYPMVVCHFGDPSAAVDVALVGNSHAAEWLPAVRRVAAAEHWRVTTLLASRCANAFVRQDLGSPGETPACLRWTARSTRAVVHGGFDLVVMANRVAARVVGAAAGGQAAAFARGYAKVLRAFATARLPVLGIRDTPAPVSKPTPACLAAHRHDYPACNGTRKQWLPAEPLTTAIRELHDPHIQEADLTRYLCHPVVCPAVIGDIPTYFDDTHMTATFTATLAPYLRPYLVRALSPVTSNAARTGK